MTELPGRTASLILRLLLILMMKKILIIVITNHRKDTRWDRQSLTKAKGRQKQRSEKHGKTKIFQKKWERKYHSPKGRTNPSHITVD